jgi:FkbM family methyltransferase
MHPLIAVLRLPLNLIPPEAHVPIVWGPLRGARWIVGSGNHVCWLGVYEYRKQQALQRLVASGSTVYDVGAHVGFHSILASRLVGPAGRVCAFEPLPRNLRYLHEHVRLNHAANVQIVEAAVADHAGFEAFGERGSYMGGLQHSGALHVQTVSIDALTMDSAIPPPNIVKMDVEGGEVRALHGMRETLATHRPTIFLATHSPDLHRECIQFLTVLGYRITPLVGDDIWKTDELMAQHPIPAPTSR